MIFLLVSHLSCAFAQNAPADQPGAQGSRFRSESEREKKRLEKERVTPPRIEFEKEEAKAPVEKGLSFILKGVTITGATVFKPSDLQSAYEPYIGTSVTFQDLEAITTAIKGRYKQKGFLSSDAYVPEQDIADGVVEIKIIEGTLGDVKVEGNKWFSADLLKKFLHLKKNDALNVFTLQRDIMRLDQNPDLDITAVVSAGKEPLTTDITLKVKDRIPYHAGITFDNQGTRLVGKYRASASVRSTNVTGWYDSLSVNSLVSADSTGEFISYAFPIGTYGARAGVDLTFFDMKLGREYRDLDITGSTRIITPHISSELALSEDLQAYADAGIDVKVIKKKNAGALATNDQLRMPYAALDVANMDTFGGGGQTVFSPRVSMNTDHFLGSSSRDHPSASRSGTGGFFVKYEQSLKRVQRVTRHSYISARSQFQAASHTLPSSEQLQLGGANSVRGYPEGDYMADMGGLLTAEWAFPRVISPLQKYAYPVVFADMGAGKLKRTGSGERSNKFLMGAGAGLRVQIDRYFFLRMDWAKRLGDRPTSGQGPSTFYISLQSEL